MDFSKAKSNGKKVAIFGSYDWGDGQFMRTWEDRVRAAGATIVGDAGFIANLEPNDTELAELRKLGEELISWIMSVVVVGGNDRMATKYKEICSSYNCKSKVFTQMPADFEPEALRAQAVAAREQVLVPDVAQVDVERSGQLL